MKARPQFIIVCGPTGVGKSRVPKEIFNLDEKAYTKLEIDSLIETNTIYTNTISTIIKNLGKKLILKIINGQDKDKHILLTELFNQLYFNVKKNIIPCAKKESLTCEQLHDKRLAELLTKNKTIVFEINGDKDFRWLFVDSAINNILFTNKHRKLLREHYDITICYLSHNYKSLLLSNKERFLESIDNCNTTSCNVRLGNFLLPKIYTKTIDNLFKLYNELLKTNFFETYQLKTIFIERTSKNEYLKLNTFKEYKNSFQLRPTSHYKSVKGKLKLKTTNTKTQKTQKTQKN
jgi:hypothetical protein